MKALTSYRWSELPREMRKPLIWIGFAIVTLLGMVAGMFLADFLGFWWALLLVLIVVMIPTWESLRREEQKDRQRSGNS